jgi:ParB-like chromosome segregation protein Spo0J
LRKQVDEYRRLYGDEIPVEFLEQFAVDKLIENAPDIEKSRANVDWLKEQIKKDGIKKPLRLECSGQRLERMNVDALLIDGNHRLIAARELGMKRVPVTIVLP